MGAKQSYSFDKKNKEHFMSNCIIAIDIDEKTVHAINLKNVECITDDFSNNTIFYFVSGKKITVLRNTIKHVNDINGLNQLTRRQ